MSGRHKCGPFCGPDELWFKIQVDQHREELARVFVPLEKRVGGFLDIDELAEHLGLCVKTIRREIEDGRLPVHKIRGRLIVKVSDVSAWLSARREG